MSPDDGDLQRLQNWMQAVIVDPRGVVAGIDSAAARQAIDVDPQQVETVIGRSSAQTSVERLAIYSHAYFARLLDCLKAEFPVLASAVGDELFDELMVGYLRRSPSRSYTLTRLGAGVASYLAETCPASSGDTSWPDFLIDLADLEWQFAEVFDGPGVEREQLLTAETLENMTPERWPQARLVTVPCLRVASFRYRIADYYLALREKADAAPPVRADSWLAITRRNYTVRHYPLSRFEFELLAELIAGRPVGAAVESAAAFGDSDPERLERDLHHCFRRWTAEGFFANVE